MTASPPETTDSPPAFTLPAALSSRGYSIRPEVEADVPFLMALFASTREEELAQTPWSPEQKAGFLAMQFNAQRTHYRTHLPDTEWIVLEYKGAPVGRIYLQSRQSGFHLVDIILAPDQRGEGLGTALMNQMLAVADRLGKPIDLFVERFNPAFRLYTRLGFTEVEAGDVYVEMKRDPRPAAAVS